MGKKRRTDSEAETEVKEPQNDCELIDGDAQKMKKKLRKKEKKRNIEKEDYEAKEIPTLSIAVPGSIIDNTQSYELATRLAGQIARAATIFRINEVVIFDNKSNADRDYNVAKSDSTDEESGAAFLIRILQYLETPQYLRKALFPRHNSLRFVGLLPPVDAPHHLRKHEWGPYREGVTVKEKDSNSGGTLVDVGLSKHVIVDQELEPQRRVTVAMGANRNLDSDLPHQIVSSSKPREEGQYWGYQVRYAHNLSSVFKDCTYKGGYDHIIGTSEHGQIIKSSDLKIPSFRHLLIAFGGLAGLEECIEEDDRLKGKNAGDVFHSYLNTCPHQGSRTIRTEEAIFISLQYLQEPISRALQS
ncbi:hypothetical protein QN277_027314 [Acacia crassicarpa]|uniref:RNA methyltransferase n=1 Tax=Acacia crassicarpa TaxID=499986 RepID=A0AAE1MIT7_9FABA|nr:hypothetical protein QN277_027314 [Acacia crassicarpa]